MREFTSAGITPFRGFGLFRSFACNILRETAYPSVSQALRPLARRDG